MMAYESMNFRCINITQVIVAQYFRSDLRFHDLRSITHQFITYHTCCNFEMEYKKTSLVVVVARSEQKINI
jgi:hypothetical protein